MKIPNKKPTRACLNMYIYFIINSVACYMFRSPLMVIVREVYFEGYITRNVKIIYTYKRLSFP